MFNLKVDGEILSSFTHIDYRVTRNKENFLVKGVFTLRLAYPKLDSMMLVNIADLKPFQLVLESKEIGQVIKTLTFDNCNLVGKNVSMDSFGFGVFGYSFTSNRIREQ